MILCLQRLIAVTPYGIRSGKIDAHLTAYTAIVIHFSLSISICPLGKEGEEDMGGQISLSAALTR